MSSSIFLRALLKSTFQRGARGWLHSARTELGRLHYLYIATTKSNAKEATELYIESLKEEDLPIPTDENLLKIDLEVSNG